MAYSLTANRKTNYLTIWKKALPRSALNLNIFNYFNSFTTEYPIEIKPFAILRELQWHWPFEPNLTTFNYCLSLRAAQYHSIELRNYPDYRHQLPSLANRRLYLSDQYLCVVLKCFVFAGSKLSSSFYAALTPKKLLPRQ